MIVSLLFCSMEKKKATYFKTSHIVKEATQIDFVFHTATALICDGNTFLVSSIVERGGGGDDVPASSSSSLSLELSRVLRFCLQTRETQYELENVPLANRPITQLSFIQMQNKLTTENNRC